MSQPSRPQARGPSRRRRQHQVEPLFRLEDRELRAPVVSGDVRTAVFPAFDTPIIQGNTELLRTGAIGSTTAPDGPSPVTSVTQFAPASQFGGDIVRIEAGPGGDFGKGVYAITRGPGENTGATDPPGKIYR